MRLTGGTLRGRTLVAPDGLDTRPTTDRVREALFNLLLHHDWGEAGPDVLTNAIVLDAFAGTGALGIEALSHGATHATFFETGRKAFGILRANVTKLGIGEKATLRALDVTRPPEAPQPCTLVFFDPPYRKGLIEAAFEALAPRGWFAPGALLVCETSKNEALALPAACVLLHEKTYGDTTLRFYVFKK